MPKSLSPSPLSPGLAAWLYCFHILLLVIYNPAAAWSHAPRSLLSLLPSEDPALSATALSQPSSSAIAVRESVNITSVTTFLRSAAPAATHSNEVGFAFRDLSRLNHSDLAAPSNFRQQMVQRATTAIVILSSLIAYISINSLVRTVNPSAFIWSAEDKDEARWIASSHSWFDRKACRWLGLCGTAHYRAARPRFGQHKLVSETLSPGESNSTSWRTFWSNGGNLSDTTWDEIERSRREIPDYIFRYAPLVHLFSGEQFWPGDIAEHLYHTTPTLNYTPIRSQQDHPTLQDLNQLNQFQEGRYIFLTSNDDVEDRPSWMEGEKNIPEPPEDGEVAQSWADWDGRIDGNIPGDTPEERAKWYDASQPVQDREGNMTPDELGYLNLEDERVRDELRKRYGGEPIRTEGTGGHSNAPAVLIVMDKGNGVVDAFWFYFYSFNLGNVVLNVRFGNHVGDWEHCLVRFHHGKPKALFFSAHSAGEAYSYEAVEKNGERPVIYSALGTHAMYATPGIHDYILPWGLLHDQTDRGPLWDPLLNSHSYTYDYDNDTLLASTFSPDSPTEWFYYNGHWGDKFYPLGDHRQYRFAGQYHYVNGPLGPRFKHLDRRKVCQGPDEGTCVIKNYIGEHTRAKRWLSTDPGSHR